jgi:2'-5' RNA ligase
MRAFIGCPLSDRERRAIGAWLDVRPLPGWRRVPLANLHLTLGFFGEQPEELLLLLAHRLRTAILPAACRSRGGRVRPFPAGDAPLLALELAATDQLVALHTAIGAMSASLGLPGDSRPFRPHITLARGRGDAPDTTCDIELDFREVCIYHSIHGADGTRRYLALECVTLVDQET